MTRILTTTAIIAAIAFAATAHANVSNPAVKARMEAMKVIGGNVKTLGTMAKGGMAFDAGKAQAAAAAIAEQAAMVPELFEANEDDPESEAKPAIWTDFADFTTLAGNLETAATDASMSIETAADLGAAMGAIGGTCKACHSKYKE